MNRLNQKRIANDSIVVLVAALALGVALILSYPTLSSSGQGKMIVGDRTLTLASSTANVSATAVTLNPNEHPVGTRFLVADGTQDGVYEQIVMEWSPSGKYVKVSTGFAAFWRSPSKVKVVELLTRTPEQVRAARVGEWRLQ